MERHTGKNSAVVQGDLPDKGVWDEFADSKSVRLATGVLRDVLEVSDTELQ